jgi:hypothetical protein
MQLKKVSPVDSIVGCRAGARLCCTLQQRRWLNLRLHGVERDLHPSWEVLHGCKLGSTKFIPGIA